MTDRTPTADTCPSVWNAAGVAIICREPDHHADLHHGLTIDWATNPVEVMWIAPGSDLLRVDDGRVHMRPSNA